MTGICRIGTSGWNYADWKERFYPRGLKAADWLAYYAQHFCTVEVNASFYRKPTPAMVERWSTQVPRGFRFALKMWRGVTHYRRLANCSELLAEFMPIIQILPAHQRGPLLIQLPERMPVNHARLDRFLVDLRQSMDAPGWQVAVEFRAPEWISAETHHVLNAHGAALCLADMQHSPITVPNAVQLVYVRRHGTTGKFQGSYSDRQVSQDAAQIRRWLDEGRDVDVFYNNDLGGHALANARSLIHELWDTGGQQPHAA